MLEKFSDKIEITLSTQIGGTPPYLQVSVQDLVIFDGVIDKNMTLKHEADQGNRLRIKINKSGKTVEVAQNKEPQEVTVEKITMNGLDIHADKFGLFNQKDNPFVEDKSIDGNKMSLNGCWQLEVPVFRQPFVSHMDKDYRDEFTDTMIACFGCSFTYGSFLEHDQTWPHFLGAKNYGWAEGGSCISSIVATARDYLKDNRCEKMIMLLPHPCRLQVPLDGAIRTLLPGRSPEVESKFKQLSRDIVMFGQGSLILSGYAGTMKDILKEISKETKLFLSSYDKETYDCIKNLKDDSYEVLPFYETSEAHELASDNLHPGPDHNREFASKIGRILRG